MALESLLFRTSCQTGEKLIVPKIKNSHTNDLSVSLPGLGTHCEHYTISKSPALYRISEPQWDLAVPWWYCVAICHPGPAFVSSFVKPNKIRTSPCAHVCVRVCVVRTRIPLTQQTDMNRLLRLIFYIQKEEKCL